MYSLENRLDIFENDIFKNVPVKRRISEPGDNLNPSIDPKAEQNFSIPNEITFSRKSTREEFSNFFQTKI